MNFATTLLLCLVCSVFSFKVTKDRRSLTDMVSMGKKYRRRSKEVEATALDLVVTESGNTALKLDAKGSKDYVAVHLSRIEARKFKAAFAASEGEPLSLSLYQYKIGSKKYYSLFEERHEKFTPTDLEGSREEKVKATCRTARSVAVLLYFFSLLLYSVSSTISVVMILAATGLIYINIPFLPDSAWDDACEFIKRPKELSKSENEETDVIPSTASIVLQNIMDKYGFGEPEQESEPELKHDAESELPEPKKPIEPQSRVENAPTKNVEIKPSPDTPHQTKQETSNFVSVPKEVSLPSEPTAPSQEPILSVLDNVSLDADEEADDTLVLDAEIIDEVADEVNLDASPEQDSDAEVVPLEQEGDLAPDDDDAAALERELAALEANLPAPTTFDPTGIEEDEDDSEFSDTDSWLTEEENPEIELELESAVEPEPEPEPVKPDPSAPKPAQSVGKETAPNPAEKESGQNEKKDGVSADTEKSCESSVGNFGRINAFTKQENSVPEEPSPKPKPAKPQKAKKSKVAESDAIKSAPVKKPEADNRNDASLFGRGFQNRTTKGAAGGKKKSSQAKKPELYPEVEQMRFDDI